MIMDPSRILDVWFAIIVWGVGIVFILAIAMLIFNYVNSLSKKINKTISAQDPHWSATTDNQHPTTTLRNFFVEDEFYATFDEWVDENFPPSPGCQIIINNGFSMRVALAWKEPVLKVNLDDIADDLYDRNEERFPDDNTTFDKLKSILKEHINIESINRQMPTLYYPNGMYAHITKKDIINNLNSKL